VKDEESHEELMDRGGVEIMHISTTVEFKGERLLDPAHRPNEKKPVLQRLVAAVEEMHLFNFIVRIARPIIVHVPDLLATKCNRKENPTSKERAEGKGQRTYNVRTMTSSLTSAEIEFDR
jgi:hypothetical protein